MVGFEKALGAVKMIKDQIQYRSRSLLNLARGYFSLLFLGGKVLIFSSHSVAVILPTDKTLSRSLREDYL